jgi:hypothetical protein
LDGEVPLFEGVVGVVGVVLGGGVVVVVVVGVVLYPDRPSLAARAEVGVTRPALTMSASGSTENARAIRERVALRPIRAAPRGLLEATTSVRVMPTSVIVRVRLGPEFLALPWRMPILVVAGGPGAVRTRSLRRRLSLYYHLLRSA